MNGSVLRGSLVGAILLLTGCSGTIGAFTPVTRNVEMPEGPPVEEIVTIFDDALHCLRGHIPAGLTFAVGEVVDATGRESYSDGGTGRFISQGAGEMVQSSLFRSGAAVVNRRDPAIAVMETQWGIRDIQRQLPVNFYISGSINSLDFIPGGGASISVAGVGPSYRQNRILVGLDLSMTDALTGRIVASVPLQRQMFSREVGASVGRFFGDTLVSLEAGGQEREAVHFVLRQMLSLATFELVGQVANEAAYQNCRSSISAFAGGGRQHRNGSPEAIRDALQVAAEAANGAEDTQTAAAAGQNGGEAREHAAISVEEHINELSNQASVLAARAIAAAEESIASTTPDIQAQKAAEALQLVRLAGQALRRAAELGMDGPRGDATAIVVQRALELTIEANELLTPPEESSEETQTADAAPEDEVVDAEQDSTAVDPGQEDAADP
jgi:curli biogenesis system outer membrane secretion channel CsgG